MDGRMEDIERGQKNRLIRSRNRKGEVDISGDDVKWNGRETGVDHLLTYHLHLQVILIFYRHLCSKEDLVTFFIVRFSLIHIGIGNLTL